MAENALADNKHLDGDPQAPTIEPSPAEIQDKPLPNGQIHRAEPNSLDLPKLPVVSDAASPIANGYPSRSSVELESGQLDERPSKRQKTRPTTPTSSSKKKPKPESPPWRRHDADGPTSYTENGRRKSGRINTVPVEHHPPGRRRITRGAVVAPSSSPKRNEPSHTARPRQVSTSNQRPTSSSAKSSHKKTPSSINKADIQSRAVSSSSRRRSISPRPQASRQSTRARRSTRFDNGDDAAPAARSTPTQPSALGRSPRIRIRVGRPGVIPLVHPDQVWKRQKIGSSFEDFWARAGHVPVEEGGLFASEDGPVYTDEMAAKDAQSIMRIEEAAEPGGLLSVERCSLYGPEAEEEPPRHWARQDHMLKAMSNFRRLLSIEQQRHRQTAKRLAEACRDEWFRRQPKSAEQLEAEARDRCIIQYRSVVRALHGMWENVRAYVNRQRLEEWEAEEQRRVKAALNEAVNLSEQKLQARRALDSEMLSDDGSQISEEAAELSLSDDESGMASSEGHSSDSGSSDSDNMSTSEDEDEIHEDGADGSLTQEQLQQKYAKLHSQPRAKEVERSPDDASKTALLAEARDGETSDESVDMEDDTGSSDGDDEDDEHTSDESEDCAEDDDADGLLGLLFNKSELTKLKTEEAVEIAEEDMLHPNGPSPSAHANLGQATTTSRFPVKQTEYQQDTSMNPATPWSPGEEGQDEEGFDDEVDLIRLSPSDADDIQGRASPVGKQPDKHSRSLPSPETDAASDVRSPDRSPSPLVTSETKPSDIDESPSVELTVAKHTKSRSETPAQARTEVPFLLRGTLREYQHDGLDWLAGLYANNTNGILADEMGLGKTIQTIALLAHLACYHEVWGPHLVVVPTSVMLNWEMEFKKWCPGFKILAYYGSQEERKRKRQGWRSDDVWNVCITSYQLVLQDQQVFKRRRWHYMILDEAHNIKNFKSQRWQTLLGFNTQARLLLTGTPLQNNLTELWSLLFFLMPAENGVGGFADLQEFHDWFQKPESQILENGREQLDDEARAIITKLHKVLRPYLLRRLKADVEKQMPAKYEHVEFCRLSKRQRELYDGFLARSDTKNTLASGNYMSIINCLMQLRKVCNHPDLFVDRPIVTSMRMQRSVVADFSNAEHTVRKWLRPRLMSDVNLSFLNLVPTEHEHLSHAKSDRIAQLSSHRVLMDMREAQRMRVQNAHTMLDPSSVASNIGYLESAGRWRRFEELQHSVYLNALRRQQRPIYGKSVRDLVDIGAHKRPYRSRSRVPSKIMSWFEQDSDFRRAVNPTLAFRAEQFKTIIEKFSCVTPAVVTRDLDQFVLGRKGVDAFGDEDLRLSAPVRWAPFLPKECPPDPWHEARMRLTIQFPDKRLLQYDCGKLQVLDKLLRKLQAGGHRALIFTQMTKVLDILEQFLNIHGHKYLRLDGATKVEQRQILTDRFNNDPRILCFILSTRSGGLGINLTGADTVIFYDQDWNPAMDKQCQDRCHRIGQTRDVHIYRLVSEHTIEANILRKASQKQMLDDVVIQEGEFTTDYFNKVSVRDVLGDKLDFASEGVSAADAALDRVLGGPDTSTSDQKNIGRVLEQAEDREDVAAARVAEREIEADDADFTEKANKTGESGTSTARQGTPVAGGESVLDGGLLDGTTTAAALEDVEFNAWGDKMHNVDEYMLAVMREQVKYTKLEIPKDKKKGKKRGKDTRKR